MKVTIFGFAGSGATSSGVQIAERLGLEFVSSGDMPRRMSEDPNPDPDANVREIGLRNKILIESQLAWFLVHDSIKIMFKCHPPIRYERIARSRKIGLATATAQTIAHDASLIEKAERYYGVRDFWFGPNFNVIIDTSTMEQNAVVSAAVEHIQYHHACRERKLLETMGPGGIQA